MKRLAILIGSGESKYGHLPGVEADLARFTDFFQSPFGGAWEPSELIVLRNPSRQKVSSTLVTSSAGTDYSIVVFSGHGGHDKRSGTSVVVNDDDEISVTQLASKAPRQLVLIDACRTITSLDEGRSIRLSAMRKAARSATYVRSCRALYDQAVLAAEEGRSTVYSCSVNQAAGESAAGGHFSRALLEHCKGWGEDVPLYATSASEILDLPTAFAPVATFVANTYYPQKPDIENGRRRRSFPLAVR